jgi:sporulation related protein
MAYHLDQIDPDEQRGFYADEEEEEYAAPRLRRVLRIGGVLVVMGVFAGGLWFAYTLGMRHTGGSGVSGEIPLIRADNRPIKVKPENPGGMQIPDRDLFIYGQQRPQVEHLLPPPEQPMARPAPPPPSPNPPVAANSLPAPSPIPAPSSAATPPAAVSNPAAPAAPPTVQPPVQPAAAAPAPVASAEQGSAAPVAPSPAKAPVRPQPPQLSRAAMAAAEILGISPIAAARPAAARAGAAHASGMRLQLGAMRSEGEARGQWEQLKRKNPDLLGNLSGTAIRADLGDKGTYYRIQTAPVGDPASADRICGALRQRHLACMVVR